jgi:hypothetical protein
LAKLIASHGPCWQNAGKKVSTLASGLSWIGLRTKNLSPDLNIVKQINGEQSNYYQTKVPLRFSDHLVRRFGAQICARIRTAKGVAEY